jgi:hypothetical protein
MLRKLGSSAEAGAGAVKLLQAFNVGAIKGTKEVTLNKKFRIRFTLKKYSQTQSVNVHRKRLKKRRSTNGSSRGNL